MGGGPVAHFAVAIALTYIAVEVLHQLKRLAAYKAAMILIALNVLAFCVMWAADLHEELFRELELMSTSAWRVIWWVPLSLFVHGDLPHLTTNMLILALVSWKLEPRIERKHFVGIFLFSGVVSGVVSLAFMRLESLPILFRGTSGAVLGLVAALAVVSSSGSFASRSWESRCTTPCRGAPRWRSTAFRTSSACWPVSSTRLSFTSATGNRPSPKYLVQIESGKKPTF